MSFNPILMDCAEFALGRTKVAFIPAGMAPPGAQPGMPPQQGAPPPMPGQDPNAGMAPPTPGQDPNAGMPPQQMPPQDPSQGGAPPAPPPQEAPPPAAPAPPQGGIDPEMIRSIIREEMAAGGAKGGKGKAGGKADLNQIYAAQMRTQKMLAHLLGSSGIGLPHDILDEVPQEGGEQAQGGAPQGGGQPQPKTASNPFTNLRSQDSQGVFNAADALAALIRAKR